MMKYDTEIDFNSRNVMTLFIDVIENHSKILEFGSASGRLTKYLKETKSCKVSIVEIDGEAAKEAIPYAEDYIIGDIMEYEWVEKFSGQCFDYILFADVLEHLQRSDEVLIYAKDLLKEQGKILISLPNIAYNGVLISLYHNRFKYHRKGILDETHLHFWTFQEAVSLFEHCGYGVEWMDAVYNPLKNSEFQLQYEDLPCVVADVLKSRAYGEVYQLVFMLAKGKVPVTEQKIRSNSGYYYIQTFIGKGNRWDTYEEQEIPVELSDEICLKVHVFGKADRFRLDPLNTNCIAQVKVTALSGIELQAKDTNGICMGGVFCFDHDDPQILYEVPDGTEVLNVKIRFIIYQKEEIYQWICKSIREQNNIIEQKENYIQEQRAVITQKDKDICEQRKIIEQKENYICEQRESLAHKEEKIRDHQGTIEQKENYICEQRKMIEEKEKELGSQQEKLKIYEVFTRKAGIRNLFNFYKKSIKEKM
ncbi:MAG: methyltransferase domain-containing protein [Eubacterium sp.]|nr:methyltransferase domain-containing protein [Eubacterium sp.]